MTEIYTVGIWTVKAGQEEEFVAAWRAMGEATTAEFPGAHGRLFQEGLAHLRELLHAFEPGTYEVSAEVSASSSR
jgi:hypothetical protein